MITYTNLCPPGYRPRHIDELIRRRLFDFGAIEIQGARWSGKFWTASAFAESVTRVDEVVELYEESPELALIGK